MNIKQFLLEVQRLQCNLMNIDINIRVTKDSTGFVNIKVKAINGNKFIEVSVDREDTEQFIQRKFDLILSILSLID